MLIVFAIIGIGTVVALGGFLVILIGALIGALLFPGVII
jgi:hypothetical protein